MVWLDRVVGVFLIIFLLTHTHSVYVHEGQPLDTAGLLLSDAGAKRYFENLQRPHSHFSFTGLDISHIDQTLSNVTSDSVITRLRAQVLQGSGSDASDAPSQPVVRALSCLALRFPPLREREQTLAVLIWARLCRFQTSAALHDSFALALTDMAQIGDVGLRRRLAHAAWHCLLRKRLGEVAALNAKVGKTLKLQLCERNFGVDDVTLMRILTLQSQFLRQWLADVQMAVEESSLAGTLPSSPMSETATNGMGVALGTSESPCPAAENILVHGTWAANAAVRAALVARPVTGGASALGPALNGAFQRQPSVGLLQAHIVLCDALRMIMLQKLRGVRALFLFGEALRARLFSPLHVPPDGAAAAELNGSLLAPEVTEAREGMAARVLSAAMHTQQPSWEEALSFVEMLGVSADFVATRKLVALVEVGCGEGKRNGRTLIAVLTFADGSRHGGHGSVGDAVRCEPCRP